MSFWDNFKIYFPVVLGGVIAVEQTIQSESGATKKQVVLDSIVAAAKAGETTQQPLVAGISALIDSVVSTLNATGVFAHSKPTPTAGT